MALALRFGPYAAIAILALLLFAAKSHINELDARLDTCAAECNSRIANGVADSARVAIRETELAVQRERERWKDLVAASNEAAISAEHARELESEQARLLREQLDGLTDPDVTTWRHGRIPDAVRRLHHPAGDSLSGATGRH